MRVTGGVARGRKLRSSRSVEIRPTTDTARKTIFDILGATVNGARVLDLFAGSGALGIEALSRGARDATFVERDRRACAIIEANLATTGSGDRARIRRSDVVAFLERSRAIPFDLVFLDPPYERGLRFVIRVLRMLIDGSWVRPGGTVVVEAEAGAVTLPAGLSEIRTRRFGRTQVLVAVWDGGSKQGHLSGDF